MVNPKLLNHLLLVLLAVFEGVQSRPKSRQQKVILLKEGNELLLNFTAPVKINILFPLNNSDSLISTSEHELIPHVISGRIRQWTFRRKKTVFGDTGRYVVVHVANRKIQPLPEVMGFQFFYVYVKSKKNLFVQKRYHNLIMTSANSSIVLPCRTTSPELEVLLINSKTNQTVPISDRVTFDSKTGFTMTITHESASTYLCRSTRGGFSAELSFTIIITGSHAEKAQISIGGKVDYFIVGQRLTLNCSVVFSNNTAKNHVTWITPRNSETRVKIHRSRRIDGGIGITNQLIINNLTFNHMGYYTCDTDPPLLQKDKSVFVNIYNDLEIKSSMEPYDLAVEGLKLKLECISWYGNALRTIRWLNKNNETILNEYNRKLDRIDVFHEDEIKETINESFIIKRSYLFIYNITKADEGTYTCLVKNLDNSTKSISYKIPNIRKPLAPYIKRSNMKGKNVTLYTSRNNVSRLLYCFIRGEPKPRIRWYKNNLPLNMSSAAGEANLIYIRVAPDILQLLLTNAESSGVYKCVGTNYFGRVDVFTEFIVSEKDLSGFWGFTLMWSMIIMIWFLIGFSTKLRHDTLRKNALTKIGLLPHSVENGQALLVSLADEQQEMDYDPAGWEFEEKDITLESQISSGGFGIVYKSRVRRIKSGEEISTVTIKKILQKSEDIHREASAKEFKTNLYLGSHSNIARIVGINTDKIIKGELLIIIEYCKYGSLLDYMLRNKDNFVDQIDPATGKIDTKIDKPLREINESNSNETEEILIAECAGATYPQPGWRTNYSVTNYVKYEKFFTQDLNYWAYQIACAMDYLHNKKVIHSDLAARNVLLEDNQNVKICDIGLAKTMCADSDYRKKYSETFPIRWMAMESIKSNDFSFESDLWSYAVALWEIYSFAEEPYPGIPDCQIYDKLASGYRMEKPRYAVQEVFDIMLQCWHEDPTLRPSFADICEKLKQHAVEVTTVVPSTSSSSHPVVIPEAAVASTSCGGGVSEESEQETKV